jgi:trigger factor
VKTLKLETEIRDDHQVRLLAEVETEQLEKSKHKAARKISNESRIPGFRPGKAPYDMVRRFVGEDKIQREAIEMLVDEVYPQAVKEAEIDPFGPGSLEEIVSTDPVKFAFLVPLAPKVTLGDYRAIRQEYTAPEVGEDKVDAFIEQLRTSYATAEPVERAAQEGDNVSTTVNAQDLHAEEGKDPVILKDRPVQATIKPQDEKEEEWPFPGFAHGLVGLSAGEERTDRHIFADDSKYEVLRGKEVEFQVKVDSVKNVKLPEVNDEFAQSTGEFTDVAAMRAAVRSGLESNAREEYEQDYFSRIIDQIRKDANIKYPPQMLDDEIGSVTQSIERDLAQQNLDLETYLKIRQIEREKFIADEVKPSAIRRLERSLLMDEIARAEEIKLSNEEMQAGFSEALTELQNTTDFEKLRKQVGNERLANAVALEAAGRMMNRRVMLRLKAIATDQPEETPTAAIATEPAPEDTAPVAQETPEAETQPSEGTSQAE